MTIEPNNRGYRQLIPIFAVVSMFATVWPARTDAGDGCNESRPDPVMQAYCTVKDYESFFEVPKPVGEIFVGTFDATEGSFNGLNSPVIQPGDGIKTRITVPARASINAVNVRIKFRVTNPRGPITLSVNGKNYSRGTAGTLFADIGEAHDARWSIRSGPSSASGRLTIDRPPIIGVGAFTLPVLPLAVVYEPPQDNQARNKAKFEHTHVVTSTFSMEFSDFESTTKPIEPTFSSILDFKSKLDLVLSYAKSNSEKAAKSGEPTAAAVDKAIGGLKGILDKGFGSNVAQLEQGEQKVNSESIEFTLGQTEAYETNERKGPGLGDRFVILRNVRFLWVVNGKKIQLTMLGYDAKAAPSARELRENRNAGWHGLDTQAINALLTVSPTTKAVATTNVSSGRVMSAGQAMKAVAISKSAIAMSPENRSIYDPARFLHLGNYDVGSGGDGPSVSYKSSTEDTTKTESSTATFSLRTESFEKGWLSYIGLGVSETKDVEAKTTYTRTEGQAVSDIVRSQVDLYAEEDEDYGVTIYLDQAFGTLAFEEYDLSTLSRVTGTAQGQNGGPIADQPVLAVVNGERYHTRTDSNGQYTVALDPDHRGTVQITAGDAQGTVQFKGAPVSSVDLRPAVITPGLQNAVIRTTPINNKPATNKPSRETEPTPKQPGRVPIPAKRLEKTPPKRN